MVNHLTLYSVNTFLAFAIAERYYRDEHHVWCAPCFDSASAFGGSYTVPPTSCPKDVYGNLMKEVSGGDRHSAKIASNKIGILNGATHKQSAGIITKHEQKEIAEIVAIAETSDFRPLLYVIPFNLVAQMVKEVPVRDRAHPVSFEYLIESLPRRYFDVLELHWIK